MPTPTVLEFWQGSRGPFLYDSVDEYVPAGEEDLVIDEETGLYYMGPITDPNNPTNNLTLQAVKLPQPAWIDNDPSGSIPEQTATVGYVTTAVRLVLVDDIDNPDLSGESGAVPGALIMAREVAPGADEYTLYAWDSSVVSGINSPYIVGGDGGYWIAVAGKYSIAATAYAGDLYLNAGQKLYMNGLGGSCYLVFEDNKLKVFVNDTEQTTWP